MLSNADLYRLRHIERDKHRLMSCLRAEANRLEHEARKDRGRRLLGQQGGARPADVAVTDHAVIRFLERVMFVDVDSVRTEIARLVPPSARPFPSKDVVDCHGILVVDDYQFLLTPTSVISVLSPDMDAAGWLALPSRSDHLLRAA